MLLHVVAAAASRSGHGNQQKPKINRHKSEREAAKGSRKAARTELRPGPAQSLFI